MTTGFVLAGGRSRRMGREKAWLTVGSKALIEIVIGRLRPHVNRLVVIGNAENAQRCRALPVDEVLFDYQPDRGPLMGLFTGLMETRTPVNVFVGCDMPWIEARVLGRLRSVCDRRTMIVASRHPLEGIQPLPLICRAEACRTIGALLNHGESSLRALVSQPAARIVMIEEPELWRSFLNVNTVVDYVQLCDAIALPSRS